MRIQPERQSEVHSESIQFGDSWRQDHPFGLSIGRGKNSLVADCSASPILQLSPLIADSRFLLLRTIRIHATEDVAQLVSMPI